MKNTISAIAILFSTSLIVSTPAFAAQESYGVPGGMTRTPDGGSVWHDYSCSAPRRNGEMLLGVGYALQIATAARGPQYNVTGCSLKSAPVVPNAIWREIPVKGTYQDMNQAVFEGKSVRITVEKENYSAVVEFSNGAVSNCKMN